MRAFDVLYLLREVSVKSIALIDGSVWELVAHVVVSYAVWWVLVVFFINTTDNIGTIDDLNCRSAIIAAQRLNIYIFSIIVNKKPHAAQLLNL